MKEYWVSYMCVFSEVVEADSHEEAAEIVERDCPYDIDGSACVTDMETDKQYEI